MPVSVTVHTCRSARERELAHDLERKLRAAGSPFAAACDRVYGALPFLERSSIRLGKLDFVRGSDEQGQPCATVFAGKEPYITITEERA